MLETILMFVTGTILSISVSLASGVVYVWNNRDEDGSGTEMMKYLLVGLVLGITLSIVHARW